MRVHVNAGYQDIAGRLMPEATGTIRLPDGGWELVFPASEALRGRVAEMQREHPGAVNVAPSRESLEDFFFRKIENQRAIS